MSQLPRSPWARNECTEARVTRGGLEFERIPTIAGVMPCISHWAIEGLEALDDDPDVVVFHAGTRCRPDGVFETAGGRVLGVTARGSDVAQAVERAYAAVNQIRFTGMHLRRDIAARALKP